MSDLMKISVMVLPSVSFFFGVFVGATLFYLGRRSKIEKRLRKLERPGQ